LQKICASEEEWSQFLESIRDNLPTTFRVTGFKDEAKALLSIIETQLFTEYVRAVAELHQKAPEEVERPLDVVHALGRPSGRCERGGRGRCLHVFILLFYFT